MPQTVKEAAEQYIAYLSKEGTLTREQIPEVENAKANLELKVEQEFEIVFSAVSKFPSRGWIIGLTVWSNLTRTETTQRIKEIANELEITNIEIVVGVHTRLAQAAKA